jgi:hypothetical protein
MRVMIARLFFATQEDRCIDVVQDGRAEVGTTFPNLLARKKTHRLSLQTSTGYVHIART